MDKELLRKMFFDDLLQKTQQLKDNLLAKNFIEIKAIAHKIKGNSAALVLGYAITNEVGQKIEKAAIENNESKITEEIEKLEKFLNSQ